VSEPRALNDPRRGDPITTAARFKGSPSARVVTSKDYDEMGPLRCTRPDCKWEGLVREGDKNFFEELFDVRCPKCDQMLIIVSQPNEAFSYRERECCAHGHGHGLSWL